MEEARLAPERLRTAFDPARLDFETTEEVEPLEGTIGQPRALEAVGFGLEISTPGYNIFATGPVGTGRRTMLEAHLRECAARRPRPGDWVYLYSFEPGGKPQAVGMPAGRGARLERDMGRFVDECRRQIVQAFQSEEYERRRRELVEDASQRSEQELGELREFAAQRGLALEATPAGLLTLPVAKGRRLSPAEFSQLPEATREDYRRRSEEVQERMPGVMSRIREIEREGRERVRELDREVALFAVGHLVDELKDEYSELEEVTSWLDQVREDMIENLDQFRPGEDRQAGMPAPLAAGLERAREEFFGRYQPNVFVTHEGAEGAPVVVETNPTYYNLFGRIEYQATLGAVTTDHRHIRPGALHRANGGYLLLDALSLLREPFVWPRLKEVLRTRRIGVENIGSQLTLFPGATLEPEEIDLDLKVILVGPPVLHALLYLVDEDVRKLFKVKAEFDVETPLGDEAAHEYAAFISRQVRREGLRHFDRAAVARVLEFGARAAEHHRKLSVRFIEIADLIAEASHWAGEAGAEVVRAGHVEAALERRIHRSNLAEERTRERIAEGTILIDLEGERVGQVNGLSVASVGDYRFGRPARITAVTGLGEGEMVNIDRETELSGPIHNKGFLILAGFLRERFGSGRPLSLAASLVFEQSYSEIEGDSASGAELFALLSSLAQAPIRQSIAVTGSVNQHGQMQAVGAINEKVEGFFGVCRERGPSPGDGVIIPAANAQNLMLREEVAEAAREGAFSVWAIESVDEGIALLTGLPAGERRADGTYPEGSVNRRVDERLAELAETARRFGRPERGGRDGREGP